MAKPPREDRTVPFILAPSKFCPRKLKPSGPNAKRYMSTGPLAGYMIACPSCGFIELHHKEGAGYVEQDDRLLHTTGDLRCMLCMRHLRVRTFANELVIEAWT